MRYNELNLERLTPDGLPLNDSAALVSRGAINHFFLKAFEAFYSTLKAEAIAAQAPFSLAACLACDDDELNGFLSEAGVAIFSPCSHDVKARMVNALAVSPLCSDDIVDALTKFAFGRSTVTGRAVYDGCAPYHFKIFISGDVTNADLSRVVGERVTANLNLFNTCTEILDGFNVEQLERYAEAMHVGGAAVSGCVTTQTIHAETPTFYDYGQRYEIQPRRQSKNMYILGDVFFVSALRRVDDEQYSHGGWSYAYEMTPSEGYDGRGSYFFTQYDQPMKCAYHFADADGAIKRRPAGKIKRVLIREPGKDVREVASFGLYYRSNYPDGVAGWGRFLFGFDEEIAAGASVCIFGTGGGKSAFLRSVQSYDYLKYMGYHYDNRKSPYYTEHVLYTESLSASYITPPRVFYYCQDYDASDMHSMTPFGLKFFLEF